MRSTTTGSSIVAMNDEPQPPATGASEDVDREDPPEEVGPRVVPEEFQRESMETLQVCQWNSAISVRVR
jgi:hypothetical protein